MDKKLRKLKQQQLNKTLEFTPELQDKIYQQIVEEKASNQTAEIAVLQILQSEMTGYQLLQKLLIRDLKHFELNEGALYLLLHVLEKRSYITGNWQRESEKTYVINKKGQKYLKTLTSEQAQKATGQNLRGDYLYE